MFDQLDQSLKLAVALMAVVAAVIGLPISYLSYKKTRAEIEKLRLETEKLRRHEGVSSTSSVLIEVEAPGAITQKPLHAHREKPVLSGDPFDRLLQWAAYAALFSSYKRLSYIGTFIWCSWLSFLLLLAVLLYSVIFEREQFSQIIHVPFGALWFGLIGSIVAFPIVWFVVRKAVAEYTSAA